MRIFLLALVSMFAVAQTVSIYRLSSEDASKGQRLYTQKIAADKAFDERVKQTESKYGKVLNEQDKTHEHLDFNSDFTLAVPKPSPVFSTTSPCWNCVATPLSTWDGGVIAK